MKKLSFLILTIFISSLLSPVLESFHVVKKYTYHGDAKTTELKFTPINEPSASTNASTKNITLWKRATGNLSFGAGEDMFTLRIPKTFDIGPLTNPIRATLHVNGKDIPLSIDLDGDEREEDYYYTDPIFVEKTSQVSYTIETEKNVVLPSVSLVGLDTDEHSFGLAFGSDEASADSSSPSIIKRADWGADETLRYKDNPLWQDVYAKAEANKDKPKSDATLKYEQKVSNIRTYLATNFPDQDRAIETVSTDNGHALVWPIEKTKQVDHITIHHTAENNQTNKDDLALIRGIYYYHTIVRGWGDIGYNYLVGQRGQIYEGRA